MKLHKNISVFILVYLIPLIIITGCQDFLDVEQPIGEIHPTIIFEDELTATASVTTLYSKLRDNGLISGDITSLNVLLGLYVDELDYYGVPGTGMEFFYRHQVLPENTSLTNLWNSSYNVIYLCNAALEGLSNSTGISESLYNQLYGEVLFIRSFVYFYLTNLFGDIPFTTTTDYNLNKSIHKTSKDLVHSYIIQDLLLAQSKLNTNYTTEERVRANRHTVSALLSRIYLYLEDWQSAEMHSTEVINNSNLYNLEIDLTKEFLKSSRSVILQLKHNPGLPSNEALTFIFEMGPPLYVGLSQTIVNGFEEGDLRKQNWVREVGDDEQSWYMSNKYKMIEEGGADEYSTVFRLSEQYLIRAEARYKNGNLSGAADDLNKLRDRAGLPWVSSADNLNEIIIQERMSELFCEYGHRWFDLKRWSLAEQVLQPIKPNWREAHLLLPLPLSELLLNPNLLPQNPGY